MTTSRIVRGTKGRIFLYVCAILIVTGLIACYNSTRVELDNVQKSNELCRQQQENLSTQLQVISDYKQRLEKSLKTEKAEHQQARAELELKINEEKSHSEKSASDATIRFNSLQQQYNLLKTQHGDLAEECGKVQKEQLDEINDLQAKTKEVQGQLKQAERDKENSLEHLQSQLEQLKLERDNLQKQLKRNEEKDEVIKLRKELSELKATCTANANGNLFETLQAPAPHLNTSAKAPPAKQISLDEGEYRISGNKNEANVADLPTNADDNDDANNNANQVDSPKQEKQPNNEQQYVLPPPRNLKHEVKPSTPNSNLKNASSSPSLNFVPPLKLPTVTPETLKIKTSESKQLNGPLPAPAPNQKFPDGIVPPHKFDMSAAAKVQNVKREDNVANFINDRYRNIVDEDGARKNAKLGGDLAEKENVANEIFDVAISENKRVEEQKRHIDSLGLGGGGEKDKAYDGGDYDKEGQNDANFEEDEDADDFGDHVQEPAIRN